MSSHSLMWNFISQNPVYSSLHYILLIATESAFVHSITHLEKNYLSSFYLNFQHSLFQKQSQAVLPNQVRCPSSLFLQKYCICMLHCIKITFLYVFPPQTLVSFLRTLGYSSFSSHQLTQNPRCKTCSVNLSRIDERV